MRIIYFDTIAGISGDMTIGALISAGVSHDRLADEIRKLNLEGVETETVKTEKNGISAVKFNVIISSEQKKHRHLKDIYSIIDNSGLNENVKSNAKRIFNEVAQAEAHIHQKPLNSVHFHEVGAIDSIVDIVGAAICFDMIGADRIYSSPVKLGSGGFVNADHGKLPVPSPATLEILKSYPTVLTDVPFELTTPTGAAIIKAMSSGTISTEKLKVERIGYGAGTKDIPQMPNLLRVMICELTGTAEAEDEVIVETNIDDMNPEAYPYVIEKLMSSGAHDAYMTQVIMKKGRPGILLSVLSDRAKLDEIVSVLFRQTTTIGVRISPVERKKVARGQKVIDTEFGRVKVKVIHREGKEEMVPEFEECKRIAEEKNIPLLDVYRIVAGSAQ